MDQRSIQEFKQIYLHVFGEEISDEDALRKSVYLLTLYKAVYGDTSAEHLENEQEENEA